MNSSFFAMARRANIQWLLNELPGLVQQGLLTPAQAELLRRHYAPGRAASGRQWLLTLFGILGAVLVGSGVILLLAHNWEQLPRPVRAGLSLSLLLFGQVVAGRAVCFFPSSGRLKESTSAFLVLAIGASLALIGQTYHFATDAEAFALTWSLLALPLVYTHDAVMPALFYFASVTTWALMTLETSGASGCWALLALLGPHLWVRLREDRFQARAALLLWGLAISLLILCGASMSTLKVAREWERLVLMYALLCAALYWVDALWFEEAPTVWQRPLKLLGVLGIILFAFVLTFSDASSDMLPGWGYLSLARRGIPGGVLGAGLPLLFAALAAGVVRARRFDLLPLGLFPVLVWLGPALGQGLMPLYANLYLFGVGVFILVSGARAHRIGVINGGLLILVSLIVARFFELELSFVVKGIAFILLGLGFLVTNWILLRRKGGES